MGLRWLSYERVSSEEQAKHGQSLDAQRERISAWAKALGHELVGDYSDDGVSGSVPPGERPALRDALAALDSGEADGLIFTALSRVSRSTRDVLDLVDRAEEAQWKLTAIDDHLDTSSPTGRFLVTVFAALAQLERETVGLRVSQTLRSMKRQGKRVGRYAPWGWRFTEDEDTVLPVKFENDVAEKVKELSNNGCSAENVARHLQDGWGNHPRSGEPWTASDVNSVRRAIQRAAE